MEVQNTFNAYDYDENGFLSRNQLWVFYHDALEHFNAENGGEDGPEMREFEYYWSHATMTDAAVMGIDEFNFTMLWMEHDPNADSGEISDTFNHYSEGFGYLSEDQLRRFYDDA